MYLCGHIERQDVQGNTQDNLSYSHLGKGGNQGDHKGGRLLPQEILHLLREVREQEGIQVLLLEQPQDSGEGSLWYIGQGVRQGDHPRRNLPCEDLHREEVRSRDAGEKLQRCMAREAQTRAIRYVRHGKATACVRGVIADLLLHPSRPPTLGLWRCVEEDSNVNIVELCQGAEPLGTGIFSPCSQCATAWVLEPIFRATSCWVRPNSSRYILRFLAIVTSSSVRSSLLKLEGVGFWHVRYLISRMDQESLFHMLITLIRNHDMRVLIAIQRRPFLGAIATIIESNFRNEEYDKPSV